MGSDLSVIFLSFFLGCLGGEQLCRFCDDGLSRSMEGKSFFWIGFLGRFYCFSIFLFFSVIYDSDDDFILSI